MSYYTKVPIGYAARFALLSMSVNEQVKKYN